MAWMFKALGVCLLCTGVGAAQEEPVTTLRVQARLVSVAAFVRDKQGHPVGGLTAEDFLLKQDGAPQELRYVSQGADLPLTLALLVDTSGSQKFYLADEAAASMVFYRAMVAAPADRASLVQFATNVRELQPLTHDVDNLQRALGYLRDPAEAAARNPGTLLFDAIVATAPRLAGQASGSSGRKAMVLLTDGGDNGSRATLKDAVAAAQQADVAVFSIVYASELDRHGPYASRYAGDRHALETLAAQTGGQVFDSGPQHPLRDTFARIEEQLRDEYLLGYRPPDAEAGSYHRIELKPKNGKLVVEARKGFYSPK